MSYKVLLIKILPEYWVDDFLDGNLYLNTNMYFANLDESNRVRFDPFDGIDQSRQVKEISIAAPGGDWTPIGGIINPVVFRRKESERLNILCMYALRDQPDKPFDKRNLAFGDVAVVIGNPIEFIRRVKSAATALEKQVFHGPVEYVDKSTHDGTMGPFRKFKEHDYQNEFRIVMTNGTGSACRLHIGNIRDIAVKGPSKDIPMLQPSTVKRDA
ncbi:MAG: hypothetical protein HY661_04775 [Betaproteobacteria bacterium]|nr:hypothetical protein [Betaproteobacteria bacterium]